LWAVAWLTCSFPPLSRSLPRGRHWSKRRHSQGFHVGVEAACAVQVHPGRFPKSQTPHLFLPSDQVAGQMTDAIDGVVVPPPFPASRAANPQTAPPRKSPPSSLHVGQKVMVLGSWQLSSYAVQPGLQILANGHDLRSQGGQTTNSSKQAAWLASATIKLLGVLRLPASRHLCSSCLSPGRGEALA
jgi:hypothetical protein